MMLPRSFRRTALRWLVDATTLAALMGSVWISAHERLLPMRDDRVAPAAADTMIRAPVAPAAVTGNEAVATGPIRSQLTSSAIDAAGLHRVAFGGAAKH